MDRIKIKDLEIFARHGVHKSEKESGQLFLVSLDLFLDLSRAGKTDELSSTVDYASICHEIADLLQDKSFNLIERCAQESAMLILKRYRSVDSVEVTVKKPDAPIGIPFEYVAVSIRRGWHPAYIALGSNMGDKEKNLDDALGLLRCEDIEILMTSSYHQTAPVSPIKQADYLNAAVKIRTFLSPQELLSRLMQVETTLGRERTQRWGPRTIDLDILLYDDELIQTESLQVPHPRMHERLFVLEPLCEIAPGILHPLYKKSMLELKESLL